MDDDQQQQEDFSLIIVFEEIDHVIRRRNIIQSFHLMIITCGIIRSIR
jgi:2-polyprenyl-3-methyl-5-hydroxy-6-metoxy-1,4-benzoquinol methylase